MSQSARRPSRTATKMTPSDYGKPPAGDIDPRVATTRTGIAPTVYCRSSQLPAGSTGRCDTGVAFRWFGSETAVSCSDAPRRTHPFRHWSRAMSKGESTIPPATPVSPPPREMRRRLRNAGSRSTPASPLGRPCDHSAAAFGGTVRSSNVGPRSTRSESRTRRGHS